MNREEALQLLRSDADISYLELDGIFTAFGFSSASPDFRTEVYYHPRYQCAKFTAVDDGLHVLTDEQRQIVTWMVNCVQGREAPPGQ